MLGTGGLLALVLLWQLLLGRRHVHAVPKIAHAAEDEDEADSDEDGDGEPRRIVGTTLAKLTSKWEGANGSGDGGSGGAGGRSGSARVSTPKPKVGYRTKGKPIKVYLEVQGEVHILRVAMAPVESVDDLHEALTMACEESGAPELRDLDFKLDAQLRLQFLGEDDVARPVVEDSPIGLLKCAKAMRAWREV